MNPDIAWLVELISFFAGLFCTASFAPQVIKIWRERNPKGVSLPMFLIMLTGVSLWFCVGLLLGSPSMMFWNGLTMVLASTVIIMKIKFHRDEARRGGDFISSRHLP